MQPLVEVKVWSRYGCFTRPEFKVERISYPILTPSAAVGILESIYWKPQFRWHVTEIWVLPHPDAPAGSRSFENYMPITLNELASSGNSHPAEYSCDKHRVQRSCLVLRRPCYLIRRRAEVFCNTTNPQAIKRQFEDRVKDGQCFHQPYMGLRQFSAYFNSPNPDGENSLEVTDNFGLVMHSAVLPEGAKEVRYRFVPCVLERGRWEVYKYEVQG